MNDNALFGDDAGQITFTEEAQVRSAEEPDVTTDALTPTPVLVTTVILWSLCFFC